MPDIRVRWADNTPELTKHLKEGLNQIEATKAGAEKMVQALGGDKLMRAAHTWVAAVGQMGGAEKLTNAERERGISLLERAIEKYRVLGKEAPTALMATLQETKALNQGNVDLVAGMSGIGKKSLESAALITGMSASGKAGVLQLATAVEKPIGAFGTLGGLARSLGPALGISFGVGAVVNFGKELFRAADELVKLSDKTGLSIGALREMQRVGLDASVSVDAMSSAANMLQKNLASGDQSVIGALRQLGLRFSDIRAMSPEQQFFTIAKAMEGVTDQTTLIGIGSELMGRSFAEILPAVKEGFGEIDHSADQATRELDAAGDAVGRVWKGFKDIATLGIGSTFLQINARINDVTASLHALSFGLIGSSGEGKSFAQASKGAPALRTPAVQDLTVTPSEQADIERRLGETLRETTDRRKAAIQAEARAEAERNVQRVQAAKVFEDVMQAQDKAAESMHAMELAAGDADLAMRLLGQSGQMSSGMIVDGYGAALLKMQAFTAVDTSKVKFDLGAFFEMGKIAPPNISEFKHTFATTFGEIGTSLPTILMKSFTGGGGAKGALNTLGVSISSSLFGEKGALSGAMAAAKGGLSKIFGKTLGGAFSAAIPGIGALIGPGLQLLWGGIKKLFGGPSEAELKGRSESADFQATIAKALNAQQRAESGGVAWKMTMIGVRDAFIATGRSAAEAEAIVRDLWNTKDPEAYKRAMQEIQFVMDEQQQDQRDLQTAIERYKFTIDELGPVMQKQQLDEQAKTLLNDWRLLVGAGIDVTVVNGKMADSINAYLQTAKRTGTEVPAAMRPILQTLIDQGKLVDENGNKFENLEDTGLTFAETMTQGFDRVVNALNRVLVGLGLIPEALSDIPDHKTITVDVDYRDAGLPDRPDESGEFERGEGLSNFAARGGLVTPQGIQHFAEGGPVFRPSGTDVVPAMLTPGEWVLNQGQQSVVGRQDAAILAKLEAIRDAVLSRAITSVQIDGREVARANVKAWDNGDVSLTYARELLGVS